MCPNVPVLKLGLVVKGDVEAFARASRQGWPCGLIFTSRETINTAGCERKSP